MKVKCNYCDQMIDDNLNYCPFCGGSMPTINRTASEQPQTIEELQAWYTSHNLPPENVTRFFIGKDIKEPRAFGIYKAPSGDFVVYKNKSDGSRAIRYQGSDEGYAVNELYQKLRLEIADQKSRSAANRSAGTYRAAPNQRSGKSSGSIIWKILGFFFLSKFGITILITAIAFLFAALDNTPSRGYYRYGGNDYYYQSGSWYEYDSAYDTWDYLSDDDFLNDVIYDDTASDYRVYDHSGMDFEDSSWYESESSYSSSSSSYDYDWDSGSSWDSSDSWDSDYSSWDSDW